MFINLFLVFNFSFLTHTLSKAHTSFLAFTICLLICLALPPLHAFDDRRWDKLPKWDPKAAETLGIDEQARKAARLIAAQVRSEAGYLAHERQALLEATNEANGQSLLPAFYPIRPPKPERASTN